MTNSNAALVRKGEQNDSAEIVTKALADLQKAVADNDNKLTARLDAIEAANNRLAADNDNRQEDGDVETKALNQFLRTGQVDAELKTLTVGVPASGGYTTAPEYSTTVIKKVAEMSPIRSLASVMAIGTGKVYIPTLATDATGGWVTEVGARPSSEPTFGQIEIDVFEHAVTIPVSRQLLEDSFIDLSGFLAERIAVKFAQAESTAFVSGDGSGKPTGILAALAEFEQIEAAQDGSDILEKLVDAFYALPAEYAARGTWSMNRKTAGIIRKAADVSTTRSSIWSDGIGGGTPATLLGAPVSFWPDLPELASTAEPVADTTPILFGDFASAYQIVDRVGLEIMRDDYTGADNGIVKFRARRRVGGKTVQPEAVVAVIGAAA